MHKNAIKRVASINFLKKRIIKNLKPNPNLSCQTQTRPKPEEIFQNLIQPELEKKGSYQNPNPTFGNPTHH